MPKDRFDQEFKKMTDAAPLLAQLEEVVLPTIKLLVTKFLKDHGFQVSSGDSHIMGEKDEIGLVFRYEIAVQNLAAIRRLLGEKMK